MKKASAYFEEALAKGISIANPSSNMDTHADYLYHGTDKDKLPDIAKEGLKKHPPHFGTDQRTWPDGKWEGRVYFTDKAHVAWHFPHTTDGAILRVHKNHAEAKLERGTGDFYTNKRVRPEHIEVLGSSGEWHPVSRVLEKGFSIEKDDASDLQTKEAAGLSKAASPGQPLPPQRPRPRAPRVPTPFDPVSGAKQRVDPFHFKPHRLGDLKQLHLEDRYEMPTIRKVPRVSFGGGKRMNVTPPSLSKSYQLLLDFVKELGIT